MNQKVKMKPSYLKIAFLDRDGTLIKDYPDEKWREIKEPEFLEGSIEGLKRLKEMGYDFIIITNQYLINDGIISLNHYQQFTGKFLKKLKEEKQNYQDMTAISSDGETQAVNQIEKYEIETLWVKLGNHATSEGVVMKMDVTSGSSGAQGSYNLNFTVTGGYVEIEDVISSIENDSTLGFKIEEFKMAPSGNDLQATFVCKDIPIKQVSSTTTVTQSTTTDGNNTANTNTAGNNTTDNNTANAANNTNTTNNTTNNTTTSNAR